MNVCNIAVKLLFKMLDSLMNKIHELTGEVLKDPNTSEKIKRLAIEL